MHRIYFETILTAKPNNRFSLQRENTNTAKMQNVKPTNVPATGILCIDNLSIIQILQLPTATKSDIIRIALSTVF